MKKIFILSTLLLAIYGCDNPTESNEETIIGTWKQTWFRCADGTGSYWQASDCANVCEPDDCEYWENESSDYWTFFNDGLLAITYDGSTSATDTYSYTIEDGVLHYINLNTGGDATWKYYIVNNNSELRFTHLSDSVIHKTFSRE